MGQLWALCTGAVREKSIYRTVNDPNKVEELLIKGTPYKLIYELGKGPSRNPATSLPSRSLLLCYPALNLGPRRRLTPPPSPLAALPHVPPQAASARCG